MRPLKLVPVVVAVIAISFTMCEVLDQLKDNTGNSETAYVGTWQGMVTAPVNGVVKIVNVNMAITQDPNEYELSSWYADGDTVLEYSGTWSAQSDSIWLTGANCAVIDSVTQTMADVPDDVCSQVIGLKVNINSAGWLIPIEDLKVIAESVGINTEGLGSLSVTMQKQ